MSINCPIYCINLNDREDRKISVQDKFNKLNIKNVIYPFIERDKRGGRYGCYTSHVNIWKDFYVKYPNNDYCLIFEDDFTYSNNNIKNILQKGDQFMKQNYNNVYLLFLHNLFTESKNSKKNDNDFKQGFGFYTHSYFISKNYIKELIIKHDYKWLIADGLDIDVSINFNKEHMLYTDNIFYSIKNAFIQNNSESDNIGNALDKFLRNKYIIKTGSKLLNDIHKNIFLDDTYFKDYVYTSYLIFNIC